MSLVPAKCPECGGNVVVDSEKDAWICDFCKTPFIVEKAINNFNTVNNVTNNITNNNEIKADVVNVYENKNSDFIIKAGELIEYNGASMEVVIPKGVMTIGEGVFDRSNITSIIFPDKIVDIGTFKNCKLLKKICIPESITSLGSGLEISGGMFAGCSSLEIVELPETMEEIGDYTFLSCEKLRDIRLPKDLKRIGDGAFKNCKSLKSINIPSNIKDIQKEVFCGCNELKDVVLPNGIINILDGAFKDCFHLRTIELPESLTNISVNQWGWHYEYGAFENCRVLEKIIIPSGVISIGSKSFKGCINLTAVTISENTKWQDDSFSGCKVKYFNGSLSDIYNEELVLTKVILDDTLGIFEQSTLERIGAKPQIIEELTISDNIKFFDILLHRPEMAAFHKCKSLKKVNISDDKMLEIGKHFYGTQIYKRYKHLCDEKKICHICGKKKNIMGKCKNISHAGNKYFDDIWE